MLDYTPRRVLAWYNLALRRQRAEHLANLSIYRAAAHGDKKHIKTLQDALED